MNRDVHWFAVGREDLVDVLLGEEAPREPGAPSPLSRGTNGLSLGYEVKAGHSVEASLPVVVVVEDQAAAETFSWLRVYAEDVFPISQFARVVRISDWEVFGPEAQGKDIENFRPGRWGSVAVGETLAQSDSEVDLRNMPLSRVASSLSLPVGRTTSLFGHGEPTRVCVDRLRTICDDARMGRRALGVDQLAPIWALCGVSLDEHIEPQVVVDLVVNACSAHLRDAKPEVRWEGAEFLARHAGLRSDSVEQRVMAFSELAQEIARLPSLHIAGIGGTLLAAGCFLVGRSTSHVFLLNRFQRIAPSAFAWFGLMAAFAGPRTWDAAWLRAVKGAERLLRPDFAWTDTSTADIGWAEFSWLAGTFDNLEQLASLPKMLPRTLGVEVVPGVVLQIRLGQGPSEEVRTSPETSSKERQLAEALIQIIGLAHRAIAPDPHGSQSERGQQPLDLGVPAPTPPASKGTRGKKSRRDA